jgi:glycosyltransferase involved in cell wall biosynthesis
MGVRFFGPASGNTGYGVAVSNFAKAFSESGINTKFVFNDNNYSKKLLLELNDYNFGTYIDFYLHCPPYNKHKSKAAYKIAYFYWEADRLPRSWDSNIKSVDELWVPCELVRNACLKARFKGPIKIVPTPIETWDIQSKINIPSYFSDDYILNDKVYKFYSIFQWQNRKGYIELLTSYYKAFSDSDNVILILKVNPLNLPGYSEVQIKTDILEIKKRLNQKYYAPVFLSTKNVSMDIIRSLHNAGDCYVSSHHGEGWGMPIHDAMLSGKQIITTQYGGVTEYLSDESAHLIKHTLGPVQGMNWSSLYGNYQNWAQPSINHLTKLFKDVYDNHDKYKLKGINAQKIANTMTIDSVSKIIFNEIRDISKKLK